MSLNGTDLTLLVNQSGDEQNPVFVRVAGQLNYTQDLSSALIDFSSKDSGAFGESRSGRIAGTITLESLYEIGDAGFQALQAAQESRQPILVRRNENGADIQECRAYVTNTNIAAPDNDRSTSSCTLQMSGPWGGPSS